MKADQEKRSFEGPVKWLVGSQLISGLKWILLYAVSGTKADPRNWMRPDPLGHIFEGEDANDDAPFWFDYLADTGDGQKATYNLAHLCLSSLWLDESEEHSNQPKPIYLPEHEVARTSHNGFRELPRGQFLFIGGDTAYHTRFGLTRSSSTSPPASSPGQNDMTAAWLTFSHCRMRSHRKSSSPSPSS